MTPRHAGAQLKPVPHGLLQAFRAYESALMSDDVVFENTSPPPDGERHEGQAAVRAFWESFFAGSPRAHFTAEDIFAGGDRCTVRWRYSWGDGSIRGVDVFRVRDGQVAEKLSYVKG